MQEVSNRNFGLLIAYVVPGLVALWGLSFVVPEVRPWLLGLPEDAPTIGGFLYVTLASVTLGMTSSVVRWAVLDQLHHRWGVHPPRWTDAFLHERIAGYEWIVQNHYRYYQFYGNTHIALVFTYACWRASLPDPLTGFGWLDGSVAVLAGMFLAGSRNALKRYYGRASDLLGREQEHAMTNGGHHGGPPAERPKGEGKKQGEGKGSKQATTQRPAEKKSS